MIQWRMVVLGACLVVVTTGCGSDVDSPRSEPVRRPAAGETAPPSFELVEVGRFGSSVAGASALGRIRALGVDASKRIYAIDQYSRSIKVFDTLGLVREVGREGAGPGEFMDPVGLLFPNDSTLLTVDYHNGRYSLFDTSGVHRADRARGPLGSLWPWPGVLEGGRVIEPVVRTGDYKLVAVDLESLGRPVAFFPYPLADVPPDEWRPMIYSRTGQSVRRVPVPFRPGHVWALDGRGGVWVGNTAEYHVRHSRLDGSPLGELRRSVLPVEVTAAERATAVSELGESVPPEDFQQIPSQKPYFRALWPIEDGVLVVREGPGDTWGVDVFDLAYVYQGTAALPERPNLEVRPVWLDSDVWMVVLDSLDVQTIAHFAIHAR